ncbi:MAG: SHOCT domain-containing protein [Desulfobacterales bacterium]|nr:SHOCT domain-containing protein [Desulfobacterales bacterium]
MPTIDKKGGDGLVKSVMLAYLILVLHIFLLVGLGFLVFFFRGIVQYMLWIFVFGAVLTLASGYWFYRKMKAEGQSLRETLNSPLFRNRTVEVSLLGGMASFRVGHNEGQPPLLTSSEEDAPQQLEWSGDNQVHELTELARLLKSGLITLDEYEQAKQKIFKAS